MARIKFGSRNQECVTVVTQVDGGNDIEYCGTGFGASYQNWHSDN